MSINSNTNPQQFLMSSQAMQQVFTGADFDTTNPLFGLFPALLTEYKAVLDADFATRMAEARDSAISSVRGSFEEQLAELESISEEQIKNLESRVHNLTAANKQSLVQLKHLEAQVSDLNAELAEARASHEQAIAKSTKASAIHQEGLTKELQGLRANLSELGSENDGLRSVNKELLSQVSSLRSEADASSSKAQAEIHRLSANLAQAQADIVLLQANSSRDANDLQDQNLALAAQVEALEAKLAAATAQLNQAKTLTTADKLKQYAPAILGAGVGLAGIAFKFFA